jgi:hypothetical protein
LALRIGGAHLMMDRGHHIDWFDSAEIAIELVLAVTGGFVFIANTAWSRMPSWIRTCFATGIFAQLVGRVRQVRVSYTLVAPDAFRKVVIDSKLTSALGAAKALPVARPPN